MRKSFLAALIAVLIASVPAWPTVAQNSICPTRPPNDDSNACASTAYADRAASGAAPSPANPTAHVSGSAVNGVATTYMRSDAAPALSTTGVSAGSYGSSSQIPQITVDANGRLTAVTTANVIVGGITSTSSVTGASTTYTSGQNNVLVQRSNSGSHMADTLPGSSPGILPSGTLISVTNNDSGSVNGGLLAISAGSGAAIKGSSLLFNGFVYIGPGQTIQFYSDGSNYWIVNSPGRAKLGAATTLNFSASGNDSTGNGTTTSLATPSKAWSLAQNVIDHNGLAVTYLGATGNYAANYTITGPQVGSCGPTCDIIQGNVSTPSNVTFGAGSGVALTMDGVQAQLQGIQFNPAQAQDLVVSDSAIVNFQNNVTQTTTGAALTAVSGGVIRITGNYTVGTSSFSNETVHWNANNGGHINVEASGVTITIVGSPAWASEFAFAQTGGTIFFDFVPTFSGTSSGTRCAAVYNGIVQTAGNAASLPGSTSCSSSTGGQYN